MTGRLRVLVYGGIGTAACDVYRRGQFRDRLAAGGIDLVEWTPPLRHPAAYAGRWFEAVRAGVASVALDDLRDAQVLLLSRWWNTRPSCTECGTDCGSPDGLARHDRATGHGSLGMDPLIRLLVPAFLSDRALRASCALVYDLDDDLFRQPAWAGRAAGLAAELDLVELLLRSADLVTVSSPILAAALAPYSARIHIVRNAVEPAWYDDGPAPPDAEPAVSPRAGPAAGRGPEAGLPSELHRLEYSMARAVTIASRLPGPGPYDVLRDGEDALLADDARAWREALVRLSGSADLRSTLAGRARERILAEYTASIRAPEWAAAYRWAAAHPGIGSLR